MTSEHLPDLDPPVDPRRRWLRILGILNACEWAGISPVATPTLHAIAYLADALSPVWRLEPMDAAVLKRSSGPYYPELQMDVDRLVGMGVVIVSSLSFSEEKSDDIAAYLAPTFKLNAEFSERILIGLREMPDELDVLRFLEQVVQAYSRLSDAQMKVAMNEDATYGDPATETGDVVDLGEWVRSTSTATANATERLNDVATEPLTAAETIDLYVDHIIHRVTHARD